MAIHIDREGRIRFKGLYAEDEIPPRGAGSGGLAEAAGAAEGSLRALRRSFSSS
ncbi:MAG: hypothetical protein ACYC66_15745 [Chloroflexota bacterium]